VSTNRFSTGEEAMSNVVPQKRKNRSVREGPIVAIIKQYGSKRRASSIPAGGRTKSPRVMLRKSRRTRCAGGKRAKAQIRSYTKKSKKKKKLGELFKVISKTIEGKKKGRSRHKKNGVKSQLL